MSIYKFCLFSALFLLIGTAAQAEDIHLSADEKVEWHQNEQKMIAIGNAVATKQKMNIRADKMVAFYEAGNKADKKSRSHIRDVHASGKIIMSSPNAKAYGNTLDYDLIKDEMVLRGQPAKIVTAENQTITATESITYYPSKNKAIALGDVIVTDNESTIIGNKMISYFTSNAQNKTELQKVKIFADSQPVKIINPQATVTGEKGIYLPKINKIRLYNNVVITQDGNILKGDFAETDLQSGISHVRSTPKSGKRVSGVFHEKEDTPKSPQQVSSIDTTGKPQKKTPARPIPATNPISKTRNWNLN